MIEEIKLELLIYNNIIIKEEILNRIIKLYNDNIKINLNQNLNILFIIISYVWALNDKKILSNLKLKLSIKNKLEIFILERTSINNSINLECIFVYI